MKLGECLRYPIPEHDLEKLRKMLQPGKKVRLFYNDGNLNNQLQHVRAVVDDHVVVYRVWHGRHRNWSYLTQSLYFYWLCFREGYLKPAGRSKTDE